MNASYFSSDTLEFLRLLSKYEVRYVIVGGEAVIYYGYPRLTGDVDFFYSPDDQNSGLLFKALLDFWDDDIPGLRDSEELQSPGYVIQFGVPPNRIDLLNSIEAISFNEAWTNRVEEFVFFKGEKIPVYIISLRHLIRNKQETARNKDLEDLKYLRNID